LVAEDCDIPYVEAERIWAAMLSRMQEALLDGRSTCFLNIGSLQPYRRKGRMHRHPRTGEEIEDPEKLWVRFIPAEAFREHLRGIALEEIQL